MAYSEGEYSLQINRVIKNKYTTRVFFGAVIAAAIYAATGVAAS
jgi:hypothetical protein